MKKKTTIDRRRIVGRSFSKTKPFSNKRTTEVVISADGEKISFSGEIGIKVGGVYPPGIIRSMRFVGDRYSATLRILVGGVYPPGSRRVKHIIELPEKFHLPKPGTIIEGKLQFDENTQQYIFTPINSYRK